MTVKESIQQNVRLLIDDYKISTEKAFDIAIKMEELTLALSSARGCKATDVGKDCTITDEEIKEIGMWKHPFDGMTINEIESMNKKAREYINDLND